MLPVYRKFLGFLPGMVQFDHSKLFVGKQEHANASSLRQESPNPFLMYLRIFPTRAMTDVNGKLKHSKSRFDESFPEQGIDFLILFGFGGQIKTNHDPHNPVLTESHTVPEALGFCVPFENRQPG